MKSSEKKSNNSYYQRWKKQQNRKFFTDFRGIQEILRKSTEKKTVRDSWGNTNTMSIRKGIPTDYQ